MTSPPPDPARRLDLGQSRRTEPAGAPHLDPLGNKYRNYFLNIIEIKSLFALTSFEREHVVLDPPVQAGHAEGVVLRSVHHVGGEDKVSDGGVDGAGGEQLDAVVAEHQGAGVGVQGGAFLYM